MSSAEVRKGSLLMRRYTLPLFASSVLLASACAHQPALAPSTPVTSTPAPGAPAPGTPAPGAQAPSTPPPSAQAPSGPAASGSATGGAGTGGSGAGGSSTTAPAPSTPAPSAGNQPSTPALPSPYVPAAPSAAAVEALRLFQAGCLSETYDEAVCGQAVRQLEDVVRDDPRQLDARLALADAEWNQAFRQPEGSAERARLSQRSLALYQQLVDTGVQDPRPYYGLSELTRDPDTRLRLLRRAVALEPRHSEAHADLAWSLLERGQVDEAMREYRLHLSLHPPKDREDAFEDLRFAKKLGELGHVREAAEVYDAVWDSTRDARRAERCQIFKTVDLDPYERIGARFAQGVRQIRAACADMPRLEHAQELERQGQDAAAVEELERQIRENPVPVEPYLELERLHLQQGRTAEAAGVMTRYFQQEKDPDERCRHFKTLSPGTARAMDSGLIHELEAACHARRP